MSTGVDLLDVNLWLALSASEHPHHVRAHRYWRNESAARLAFCRLSMLGFLRLVSNPMVMGEATLKAAEAWTAYERWRERNDVVFAAEPLDCEQHLSDWAGLNIMRPRLWTDAYLAAFAVASRMRLVSFDRDFRRFPGLELLLLEA
jgi:toxin-antitoxin system PIN domain toxin